MASRDSLKKTEKRGVFYREHESRKHGIHKDRQWIIRQTLGGVTRLSSFGWSSLAKQYDGTDADAKIEYAVKSFGDACNRLELYRDNHRWNTLHPDQPPRPICKQDEIDAALLMAERITQQKAAEDHKNTPFGVFFESDYLPQQETNKKTKITLAREKSLFKCHIKPVLGTLIFSEIQPLHLERIKKNMTTAKQAPRSIEYCLAVIRQVWAQALRDGITDRPSPTKGVKKPKINNKRDRFLTYEEEALLLAELAEHSQISHDMAVMSLDTGARWGELAKLKWQQVNLDGQSVRLLDTKNGSDRTAHLETQRVITMLTRRQKEASDHPDESKSPYVFPDRNGGEQQQVNRVFFRVIEALGLNQNCERKHRISFHSFRHTCASRLAMAGIDLYRIKEILGHRTIKTTERYAHLSQETLKQALSKLEQQRIG